MTIRALLPKQRRDVRVECDFANWNLCTIRGVRLGTLLRLTAHDSQCRNEKRKNPKRDAFRELYAGQPLNKSGDQGAARFPVRKGLSNSW